MTLHNAIITVLTNKPNKTATIEEIAEDINVKQLYKRRDKQPLPSYQVMMRTKLSKGKYHHLFTWIEPDKVQLK